MKSILRYFQRGYEQDPKAYWLPSGRTAFKRLVALRQDGLLEQPPEYPLDLWRITPAGRAAIKEDK